MLGRLPEAETTAVQRPDQWVRDVRVRSIYSVYGYMHPNEEEIFSYRGPLKAIQFCSHFLSPIFTEQERKSTGNETLRNTTLRNIPLSNQHKKKTHMGRPSNRSIYVQTSNHESLCHFHEILSPESPKFTQQNAFAALYCRMVKNFGSGF